MKIEGATHEEIATGKPLDIEGAVVCFSLCERGAMNRNALACAVAAWRHLSKTRAIIMHVGGYDDDKRELWQIPEVRKFVERFCAKTKAHEHPALDPTSKALLLACGADPTLNVTVNVVPVEQSLDEIATFLKGRP